MTRCEAFYKRCKQFLDAEDYEGLEAFCQKEAEETIFRVKKYIQFIDTHMPDIPYGLISETALRPLIQEGDLDVAVKVVEKIKPMLVVKKKRGKKKPRVTSDVVKKALAEVKGEVYLTPTERKEVGSETRLKQTEAACDEFLTMDSDEREGLLNDLRRVVDLLGSWGARAGPNMRAKIEPVRAQVDALRNEFLLFLPED